MTVRPRVALVPSSYHPRVGGVEQHVRQTARALVRLGYDVQVWTVARDGVPDITTTDDITVRHLPCPLPRQSVPGLAQMLRRSPSAVRAWHDAVRRWRPDVVHVHCFGPNGPWALAVASLLRAPLVVSSHGETFADAQVFTDSVLLRTVLRRSLRRAAAVTGCSQAVLRDLQAHHGLRGGLVIGGGVEPTNDPPPDAVVDGMPSDARYVLGAGRQVRVKGFDVLVAAGHRLPTDCWVVLAGDGDEHAALGRAGSPRLRLLGAVSTDEVMRLMSRAAAVVVPSRREAYGLVVLEAWASGTPVVASAVDGLAELVTDRVDGLLVRPDDDAALADAISTVLQDSRLADRLVAAGRHRASELTWAATARAYDGVYARVTGASSRSTPGRRRRGSSARTC